MLLKGFTSSGQRVDFSLSDCPIYISDKTIALAGVKMSRLLKVDTISRGDESSGVYEGDLVTLGDETLGHVIYSKGFKMQDLAGNIKNIPEGEHIKMIEGTSKSVQLVTKSVNRTELSFCYQGLRLFLKNFLTKTGDNIVIVGSEFNKKIIIPSEIKHFTGYLNQDEGKGIYFGDITDGGVVVLHEYVPKIKVGENKYKSICDEPHN